MVIGVFPISARVGGVASITTTVLVAVALLPALSTAVYVIVYVPGVLVSTLPLVVT